MVRVGVVVVVGVVAVGRGGGAVVVCHRGAMLAYLGLMLAISWGP